MDKYQVWFLMEKFTPAGSDKNHLCLRQSNCPSLLILSNFAFASETLIWAAMNQDVNREEYIDILSITHEMTQK